MCVCVNTYVSVCVCEYVCKSVRLAACLCVCLYVRKVHGPDFAKQSFTTRYTFQKTAGTARMTDCMPCRIFLRFQKCA